MSSKALCIFSVPLVLLAAALFYVAFQKYHEINLPELSEQTEQLNDCGIRYRYIESDQNGYYTIQFFFPLCLPEAETYNLYDSYGEKIIPAKVRITKNIKIVVVKSSLQSLSVRSEKEAQDWLKESRL